MLCVGVLCAAVMACAGYLEFCLPHSASVRCTPGPVRLGTQGLLCVALSQTTLLIARLTPLPSAPRSQPQLSDPLALPQTLPHPSPVVCHTHWNTLCAGPGVSVLSLPPLCPGLQAPRAAEAGKGCSRRLHSPAVDEGTAMSLLTTT